MKGYTVISDNEASMKSEDIISSVYEYDGKEFALLYQGNIFMRKIGDQLIGRPIPGTSDSTEQFSISGGKGH